MPDLTGVIVGPNDLLGDLGLPGQSHDSVLRDVIGRVFVTAKAHGIEAGTITGDRELLEFAIESGADAISIISDMNCPLPGARAQLGQLRPPI